MTQSGQGGQGGEQELPAGRPAHEGVVLPSDGGAPWNPGAPTGGPADQGGRAVPAGGQPWGQPWGPQSDTPPQPDPQAPGAYGYPQQPPQSQPLPPAQPVQAGGPYGQHQQSYGGQGQGQQAYGQGVGAYQQAQQPQHAQHSDPYQQSPQNQQHQQNQQYPSQQPHQPHQPQPYAQPLPPEAGAGAGAGGGAGAGLPGGDVDATQYIAPVPAGDVDATQYIPPVPGGAPYGIRPGAPEDRQPPAEFDNLFRAEGPAPATQQIPHFDAAQQAPQQQPPHQQYNQQQQQPSQSHQPHQPHRTQQPYPGGQLPPQASQGYQSGLHGLRGGDGAAEPPLRDDGDAPRRRSAHIPLIAAVVVGCAVVGLGAGALLSGGGGDQAKDDKQPVASQSSPVQSTPTKAPVDPAKPQAEALDKLLADSNNSRAAVISAVEKIKSCKDLDRANTDLKDAAQQRRDLVTRLEGLTLDQLPQHAALTSSLTRAWKASEAADEHYAAWARQAKRNKSVCKGGQARSTNETARANRQSGEATKAKQEASALWNAIAEKHGLTKHTPQEL
ncbi:hypothetical protein [Streptomyces sp. NPDC059452]|uniref:hypothetical protein n=1 Tax=Streptomyces sp. NPDC059452 TaxID=3346835 RepID=UPI003678AA19